jgi:transcriptional regulator with XRE-family HTH domain
MQTSVTIEHRATTRVRSLAEAVRVARGNHDMTQRELAHRIGVHASHIAYIESGRRRPSMEVLVKLCGVLELPQREMALMSYPALGALMNGRN